MLPEEDADEFAELEAALMEELAPVGPLRPCSRAASRWPRGASRGPPVPQPGGQEAELFAERHMPGGGVGLALIRDGNGTRWFETRWPEPAPTVVVGAL